MSDIDFKFENFEEYFGGADQVKKTIDECKVCGSKLLLSHMPDYKTYSFRKLLVVWIAAVVTAG